MSDQLDDRSREILGPQRPPEHVERRQVNQDPDKASNADKPKELTPADDIQLDKQEDHFTTIYNKARQVEKFAEIVVEPQIAKKLEKHVVSDKRREILDAEERLFGTRTGEINYSMYKSCLAIVGRQMKDFAGKASITPETILAAVGGNLENALNPEMMLKDNPIVKDGKIDFADFAPLEEPDLDSMQKDWILELFKMILDIAAPGLKDLLGIE